MLGEAVEIIRALWAGGAVTYRGRHFDVESAKVWDLPDTAPPIGIAVSGPASCLRAMDQFRWFTGCWRVNAELPVPASFDAAATMVREDDVSARMPCGPDAGRHVAGIREFAAAGVHPCGAGADRRGHARAVHHVGSYGTTALSPRGMTTGARWTATPVHRRAPATTCAGGRRA